MGVPQNAIADKVKRSQAHVSKRLALLELPETAQRALSAGKITLEDAPHFRKLADHPEHVDKAIEYKRMRGYLTMSQAIDHELSEQRAADVKQKAKERAKSEGIKLVGYPTGYTSAARVLSKTDQYRGVPFTKAEHKKEPCHAAALEPTYGLGSAKFVYVCTDPTRHNAKGESKLKLPKDVKVNTPARTEPTRKVETAEEKAAKIAQAQELADHDKRRHAWLKELVASVRGRKISKDEMASAIANAFVRVGEGYENGIAEASVVLGVEPRTVWALTAKAEKYIAESASNLMRFAFAAALFSADDAFASDYDNGDVDWYVQFLERHGYEVSELETKRYRGPRS